MSVTLPIRFCRVTIKSKTSGDDLIFTYSHSQGPRIDFNIVKLTGPGQGVGLNTCQVELYNLTDNTSKFLLSQGKQIIVEAGYSYNFNVIYVGDLRSITQNKQGADIITTM